jgi:hypothetical protein
MQRYLLPRGIQRRGVCCTTVPMKSREQPAKIGALKCPLENLLLVPPHPRFSACIDGEPSH